MRDRQRERDVQNKRRIARGVKDHGIPVGPVPQIQGPEVDLHGMTADEAEREVRRVLTTSQDRQVVFVHGFHGGTTLQKVVRRVANDLRKEWSAHPTNKGATVVTL